MLYIKNIDTLVTLDSEDRVLRGVTLKIKDGLISDIGKDLSIEGGARVIDGSRFWVYPGLINTHHHYYQMFTRNLPQVQNMELFDWLKTLYKLWQNINADTVYYSSLVAMGQLAKYGCTTSFDHHYVFPKRAPKDLIDVQIAAAKDLGMRFTASRGSMSLSEKDGGLPPDSVVQNTNEILKDSQRLIERYHDTAVGAMNQIVLAPCSPFSVSEDLMRQTALLAKDKKVRLHTHLCETVDEERYTLEKTGLRPLAYMQSLGWLNESVWYAHGIHFNDEELKQLAKNKVGVSHCPISNMKLSSGVARIPEMVKCNIPVGLAVDGSASNDGSNLLEEIRVCYLLHKLKASSEALSAKRVLELATKGGAKLLGRTDIGNLKVGNCADLFAIDKTKLALVGTSCDPIGIFATVGYNTPVDLTMVAGKIVVKDGRLITVDEEKLARRANIESARLI